MQIKYVKHNSHYIPGCIINKNNVTHKKKLITKNVLQKEKK